MANMYSTSGQLCCVPEKADIGDSFVAYCMPITYMSRIHNASGPNRIDLCSELAQEVRLLARNIVWYDDGASVSSCSCERRKGYTR